jgi:hypothetical protein
LTSLRLRRFNVEMRSPVEAVQAQVDAHNARDALAFTACYHPEATVVGPDGDVMVEGSEAINALYTKLLRIARRCMSTSPPESASETG